MGRSSVAAALARRAVRAERRVLAVDMVADGGLARAVADGGTGPSDRLEVIDLELERVVREYVQLYLKIPIPATNIGPIKGIFDYVATAAPGVREILTIGKVVQELQTGPYDVVVADGPATGHVVELLAAPENLASVVGVGPLTAQADRIGSSLRDHDTTEVVLVTLPTELAVNEVLELRRRILDETDVAIGAVVVNQMPHTPATAEPEGDRAGAGQPPSAATIARARADDAAEQRARLDGLGLPVIEVPVVATGGDDGGGRVAEEIGAALDRAADECGWPVLP